MCLWVGTEYDSLSRGFLESPIKSPRITNRSAGLLDAVPRGFIHGGENPCSRLVVDEAARSVLGACGLGLGQFPQPIISIITIH